MGREAIGHADFVVLEGILGALTNGDGAGSALIVVLRDNDAIVVLCIGCESTELGIGGLGVGGLGVSKPGVVRIARSDVLLVLLDLAADSQCLKRDALWECHGLRRDGQLAL